MADVEEIKKRLDIVAVISDYLTLKKSGISFKAVCPFHSEKTPSFTVSPERQSWHCFGCSEGGDVISFVQKIDGLTFTEALERLAPRAGVEYKPASPAEVQIKSEKSKILDVLDVCARLYHEILLKHPTAKEAREYLTKRGIDAETIEKFRLGYAPNAWETVSRALTKKEINAKYGEMAGMTIKRNGRDSYYDRFRGRIVFPIDNQSSQIIGFTGRIMQDVQDQPKYLNTSESLVFKKSEVLYGISFAKSAIRELGFAVVVEGQMDVITAHQFGFNNTVATSGTALTADHIKILKRYTEKIAFSFDADTAGIKALKQAAYLSWEAGVNPLVISVPFGKDPDECIRKDAKLWDSATKEAKPIIDHFINFETAKYKDIRISTEQKKNISAVILPFIAAVPSAIEQSEYILKLANAINVPDSSVVQEMKMLKLSTQHKRNDYEQASKPKETVDENPSVELEKKVVGLLIAFPDTSPNLPDLVFDNLVLGDIYKQLKTAKEEGQRSDSIVSKLSPTIQKRLNVVILDVMRDHSDSEITELNQEIQDCINRISDRERDSRVHSNAKAIAEAYSKGDREAAKKLLKSLERDMVRVNNSNQ